MTPMDKRHEEMGIKPSRHPFTPTGGREGVHNGRCAMCVFSEGHVAHSGAEVINLAQFRQTRGR